MASQINAFAALNAIGSGQAPASGNKKKKNKKAKAQGEAAAEVVAPAAGQDAVVEVGEACAVLDKTARTFKSGSDRLKLWKDWIKQVGTGSAVCADSLSSGASPNSTDSTAASSALPGL